MFRATHSLLPKYFCDMFVHNSDIHEYDTRHKADVHSTHHRLNCLTFSIRIYGPTLWNSLAIDLRNVSAYNIFRNRYKHILLNWIKIPNVNVIQFTLFYFLQLMKMFNWCCFYFIFIFFSRLSISISFNCITVLCIFFTHTLLHQCYYGVPFISFLTSWDLGQLYYYFLVTVLINLRASVFYCIMAVFLFNNHSFIHSCVILYTCLVTTRAIVI